MTKGNAPPIPPPLDGRHDHDINLQALAERSPEAVRNIALGAVMVVFGLIGIFATLQNFESLKAYLMIPVAVFVGGYIQTLHNIRKLRDIKRNGDKPAETASTPSAVALSMNTIKYGIAGVILIVISIMGFWHHGTLSYANATKDMITFVIGLALIGFALGKIFLVRTRMSSQSPVITATKPITSSETPTDHASKRAARSRVDPFFVGKQK